MDCENEKAVLEEQFILRLPLDEARTIRQILHQKPEKISKLLKIDLNTDNNNVVVYLTKNKLNGILKKLPTIIESSKTNICNNKSVIFKTADICYIAECGPDFKLPKCGKNEMNYGLCPSLKNVRKKRLRKTMYNTECAIEAETVTKELYYLLSTDLEAISSKFEILHEGDETPATSLKQYEKSLFGQLSSDSEVQIKLSNSLYCLYNPIVKNSLVYEL